MFHPAHGHALLVSFHQFGVIPGFRFENQNARPVFIFLKTPQGFGNTSLGGLVFFCHRNAVSVVPYRHSQRHLHDGRCVECFPKMAFGSARITDGSECHLITVYGKIFKVLQFFRVPELFGGQRQAQKPGHLSAGGRYIAG